MLQRIRYVALISAHRGAVVRSLGPALITLAWLAVPGQGFGQCLYRPPSVLPNPGIKLLIRADKPVFEIGKPVTVYVQLSNESKVPLSVTDRLFPERDYELHVRDSSGKEAPLTKWGRQIRTFPIGGSTTRETLAPGEKHADEEDLTRLYEITVPGEYTVEACRDVGNWGNVYSNRIKIGFVEAAPPRPPESR